MNDKKESKSSIPFPIILLIATVIAGGVFEYYAPLDSMRPTHEDGRVSHLSTEENVLARMWQDPFQAVKKHEKRFKKILTGEQIKFKPNIKKGINKKSFLILPVLTTAGIYSENIEKRIRSRYAVLSALHVAGYKAENATHIGVFSFNDIDSETEGENENNHNHLIPYEWFVLDPLRLRDQDSKDLVERILVLWVGDEYFHENRITELNKLLTDIETILKDDLEKKHKSESIIEKKIIGPSSSVYLEKIYDELKQENKDDIFIDMFSPWATADPFLLNYNKNPDEKTINNIKDIIEKWEDNESKNENSFSIITSGDMKVSLKRTIHTDQQLTDVLVDELERRGIKVGAKGSDHIVLISEWDTSYGRALPISFAISIEKYRQRYNSEPQSNSSPWPDRIHKIGYMRGIDGMLPGEDNNSSSLSAKTTNSLKRKGDSNMGYYTSEFKQPLGQAQFDYIRRLEKTITKEKYGGRIRAIGVLGSDIYDKLLILRALRGKFPNAIFFTNDLDARLFHETELPWTRNLIVASSYGLQLHPKLQKYIPPFRTVYQSSLFVATLQALGVIDDKEIDFKNINPRIFEIGRHGPYDLTPIPEESTEISLYHDHQYLWEKNHRSEMLLYIFFILILPLLIFGGLIYGNFHMLRRMRDSNNKLINKGENGLRLLDIKTGWIYFGISCLLAFTALTCIAFVSSWNGKGEPLTFFEGISIWPTELIRLFSGFLAVFFIMISIQSLIHNRGEIDQFISKTEDVGKNGKKEEKASISSFWEDYKIEEGNEKGKGYRKEIKKSLCVASIFVIIYFGLSKVFLLAFGVPVTPFRGELSRYTDICILFFSLVSMLFLAWFAINRIYYCRRFFHRIVDSEKPSQLSNMIKTNCYIKKEVKKECDKKDECHIYNEECLIDYDKHLSGYILVQWLKLQIIAKRTVAIGKMIIYPFIIFALLLIARNNYFDHWSWTIPLVIVVSLTIIITLYCAFVLFYIANFARRQTISLLQEEKLKLMNLRIPSLIELNKDRIHKVGSDKKENLVRQLVDKQSVFDERKAKLIEQKSKYIDHIISDLQNLRSGAFAPLGRSPIFFAILTPLGGLGSISILQHLLQLFNK